MATKVKTYLDFSDSKTSTIIISSTAALGLIYSMATKKGVLGTIGITLGCSIVGVVAAVITNNLTDGI